MQSIGKYGFQSKHVLLMEIIDAYQQACPIYQLVDDCGIMGGMALWMVESKAPENTWGKTSQKVGKGRWNLDPSGIERVLKQVWFFICDQNLIHFCTINCYREEIGIYQLFSAYRHFRVESGLFSKWWVTDDRTILYNTFWLDSNILEYYKILQPIFKHELKLLALLHLCFFVLDRLDTSFSY